MKQLSITFVFVLMGFVAFGQPASPPAESSATVNGNTITIKYSQPAVKGRDIWGGLVPYGKVWRAGANETTSIEFSADAKINGKALPKGKYAFFVIPTEKEWTLIFNKTIKWGAFSYKQDEDVLRITVPVKEAKESKERLSYEISKKGEVSLLWEHAIASFTVK